MSEHTPGPWHVAPGDPQYVYAPTNAKSVAACSSKANARLIAAAPDLLAACKRMIVAAGDRHMPLTKEKVLQFVEVYAQMRAAITKAEGAS